MKKPLEPDSCYHVYNHANGYDKIFYNDGNYLFFLKKYALYINPIADTFAYCLMPNHIHFAVRIKGMGDLLNLRGGFELSESFKLSECWKAKHLETFLSRQFANLFSSYTQALNKQQNRIGSLFIPNFKRKLIDNDQYFRQIIHYIHYNPVHHNFVKDLRDWRYSSFEAYFSDKPTRLAKDEVIRRFGSKEEFWRFHQMEIDEIIIGDLEV